MTNNSRKPVCPACAGVGHWHATLLDPSEYCELCNGAGRVNKRTARRYKARAFRRFIRQKPFVLTGLSEL